MDDAVSLGIRLREYKEREESKYNEWKKSITGQANFPIYIYVGDFYWLKESIDSLSMYLNRRPDRINKDLKKYTERMKFKSLARKKHFVWFDVGEGKISEKDMESIKNNLLEPSENGVLFISLNDRSQKKYFLRRFRNIRTSKYVKFMEMEYVSSHFKRNHIINLMNGQGINFESEKLKKETIKNLALNMDELEDNIMTLKSLDKKVLKKEDVWDSIERYGDANIRKLYTSLAKLDRKNVPYKVLHELIEEEELKPQHILNGIKRYFHYLYQAKYLKVKGILRARDNEMEKEEIYEEEGLIFNDPSIWDLSKSQRNRYLEDCDDITLSEILKCNRIIEENIKKISYRVGDDMKVIEIVNEEDLFTVIVEMMGRSDYF